MGYRRPLWRRSPTRIFDPILLHRPGEGAYNSAPLETTLPEIQPLVRTLLLHTGGSFWVDVAAVPGARDSELLRWFPGSPKVEMGLAGLAVGALPLLGSPEGRRVAHFVLHLSPKGPLPAGGSAQLALVLATLGYWWALRSNQRVPRMGGTETPGGPWVVLSGSGTLDGVASEGDAGLGHYRFLPVEGWEDKIRQLIAAIGGAPVAQVQLFCPQTQEEEVRVALLACGAVPTALERLFHLGEVPLRLWPVHGPEALAQRVMALGDQGLDLEERLALALGAREQARARREDVQVHDDAIDALREQLRARNALKVGDTLERGRFLLDARAGEGGFAEVWRAHDQLSGATVAVKVLHEHLARDGGRVRMFFGGARQMASLHHPGVPEVSLERGDASGGRFFFVQEFLPGGSLEERVRSGATLEVGRWISDIAAVLIYAHAQGVLHGDVKPANVLFDAEDLAHLIDFDVSRQMQRPLAERSAAVTTGVLGTLLYAAPEVLTGNLDLTPATDIYSLGMTALFALHGAELPLEAVRNPEPFVKALDCPEAVKHVLHRTLMTRPLERYADATSFDAAWRTAWQIKGGPAFLTLQDRDRGAIRRWRMGVALLGSITLLGLSFLGLWLRLERLRAERDRLSAAAFAKMEAAPADSLALLRAAAAVAAELGDPEFLTFDQVSRLYALGGASLVLPTGHAVVALAPSPDGGRVAAGLDDGTLAVWDIADGRRLYAVDSGLERIQDLAWSPLGDRIAVWTTPFEDQREPSPARILDGQTGALLFSLPHTERFNTLTWSPDGRRIATGAEDAQLNLWDARAGAPLRTQRVFERIEGLLPLWLEDGDTLMVSAGTLVSTVSASSGAKGPVWSAKLRNNAQGKLMLSQGRYVRNNGDGVTVIDARTGAVSHSSAVPCQRAIAASPDERWIACTDLNNDVGLLDLRDDSARTLQGHTARARAVSFSPNSQVLASGGHDGAVWLWSPETAEPLNRFVGHGAIVSELEFFASPNGAILASGGIDGSVRLWPTAAEPPNLLRSIALPSAFIKLRELSSDGRWLVAATKGGELLVWDLVSGGEPRRIGLALGGDRVESVAVSRDGAWLAVGLLDGHLRLANTEAEARSAVSFIRDVGCQVRAFPDGRHACLGSWGWNLYDAEHPERAALSGTTQALDLQLTPDGGGALIAALRGGVAVWDIADRAVRVSLAEDESGTAAIALSPEGDRVAATFFSGRVRVWALETGQESPQFAGHAEAAVFAAWSPDGRMLATGSWDDTVRLWDSRSGALVHELRGHTADVGPLAFSPDARLLISGDKSGAVRVWDVESGALLALYRGNKGSVQILAVQADGQTLVSVDASGKVMLWRLPKVNVQPDLLRETGAVNNLRVCRETGEVVPVLPWPDPSSVWADPVNCPKK